MRDEENAFWDAFTEDDVFLVRDKEYEIIDAFIDLIDQRNDIVIQHSGGYKLVRMAIRVEAIDIVAGEHRKAILMMDRVFRGIVNE